MRDTKKTLFEKYSSGKEITKEDVVDYLLSNVSDMIIAQKDIPIGYLAIEALSREVNSIKISSKHIKTRINDKERN